MNVLVCNAAPPLQPMWLARDTVRDIADYVSLSCALVAAPLAAFAPDLRSTSGHAVIVSSVVTETPHPDWIHYNTAKHAVEGIARSLSNELEPAVTWIVRPPRLATEMTNTPTGHMGALRPEVVAARVVSSLLSAERGEGPRVLTGFDEG